MFLGILIGMFVFGVVGLWIFMGAIPHTDVNLAACNLMGAASIFNLCVGFFGVIGWILEVCL